MNTAVKPKFFKHIHANQALSYDDVLEADSRQVPDVIRDTGVPDVRDIGPFQVPTRWYLDRAIHELEVEKIWKKTWQYACRSADIPEVGDTFLYEIAGMSFIIVRAEPDLIKGYWNACLHRGVALRKCSGKVDRLQCPFHGFTWGLDGKNQVITQPEDFPHIDPENFSLPEIKIGEWDGFIFINADLDAEPLERYIGTLPDQFARWPWAKRHQVLKFAKIFPANWKALQEAFMESFHVLVTHPQQVPMTSDRCSQFGIYGNFSRGVVVTGYTHEYMARTPDEQEMWDRFNGLWDDEERPAEFMLPEGKTARGALADRAREALAPLVGEAADAFSDTELIDVFYWSLFPNFHPFGYNWAPMLYHFYPNGDDHASSVMEITVFTPTGRDEPLPPTAPTIWVPDGKDFTSIEELGALGPFLSQDIGIMDRVMKGIRNNQNGYVNFGRYHESKIRHFYSVYEHKLGLSASEEISRFSAARDSS